MIVKQILLGSAMGGVLENSIKNLQSDIRVFKAYPFYSHGVTKTEFLLTVSSTQVMRISKNVN